MSVVPDTWDEKDNSVEVTFSAGARGKKYDWRTDTAYIEDLPIRGMILDTLNEGAHVLRNHGLDSGGRPTLKDVFGAVVPGSARAISDTDARARLRFSRGASNAELVQDIKDSIVRKWSYGYVKRGQPIISTDKETGLEVRTWENHEPFEISATPVPFDSGASTRNAQPEARAQRTQEDVMTEDEKKRADELRAKEDRDQRAMDIDAARAEGRAEGKAEGTTEGATSEATRTKDIRTAAGKIGLSDHEGVRALIEDPTISIDDARSKLFDIKAEADNAPENDTRVVFGSDGTDSSKRTAALTDALAYRAKPDLAEANEGAKHFQGFGLREIARDCAKRAGHDVESMGPSQLFEAAMNMGTRAHSTSDFPLILANAVNKNFRTAFAQESLNFADFAGRRVVSDFKEVKEIQLGNFTTLPVVPEGAEIKYGTMGELQEVWAVLSYGERFGITRQAMINDDMGAFGTIPVRMSSMVNRTMLDVFWALFTANANLSDGTALFHADHGNYTAAGSGGAPSVTQIGNGRLLFNTQTDINGNPLALSPTHIMYPAALQTTVDLLRGPVAPTETGNVVPGYINGLIPIWEPRLDNDSKVKWYMASKMWESVVYGFLAGQEAPRFTSREDWDRQGMEFKLEHDFGAGITGSRGLYLNDGA